MRALKSKYLEFNPGGFYLEPQKATLEKYLLSRGLLNHGDGVKKIEKPGPGNMNAVFRVIPYHARSFVVKQARPWVEKYPELDAPVERTSVENSYYHYVNRYQDLSGFSPKILGFDPQNSLLVMEDFGESTDYGFVYGKDLQFGQQDLNAACTYLNKLKDIPVPELYPANIALRRLNHQHIFKLPFTDNTFELDHVQSGLGKLAKNCKQDHKLLERIDDLGKIYLSQGSFLLHGDFYPGSFLKTATGFKVIDPEFSFMGPEEWDIGVFMAHLFLSGTPVTMIESVLKQFEKSHAFSQSIFSGYVGTEILRRLIGLAQLPLEMTLDQKQLLTDLSLHWIKTGTIDKLST